MPGTGTGRVRRDMEEFPSNVAGAAASSEKVRESLAADGSPRRNYPRSIAICQTSVSEKHHFLQ